MLEQDPQLREFAQVLDRDRGNLEAALAFGDDKAPDDSRFRISRSVETLTP